MVIHLTAAIIRTVLLFIDPTLTPKIAFDRDDLAQPLIDHLKQAVGDADGSIKVQLSFEGKEELEHQFYGVCGNIERIFDTLNRAR